MTCGIYMLYNYKTRKAYIGQSVNIERRIKQHTYSAKYYTGHPYRKLYESVKKHGFDVFNTYILEICDVKDLNDKEMYYIGLYESLDNGYNMTIGGEMELGEDNFQSKLSNKEVEEIKYLLKNSDKSLVEISKLYSGASRNMITSINIGTRWSHIGDYTYPIRDNIKQGLNCRNCGEKITFGHKLCVSCSNIEKANKHGGENHHNSRISEEEVLQIKNLLKNSKRSISEIASLYSEVTNYMVYFINLGRTWRSIGNYNYPIREDSRESHYCKICGKKTTYGNKRCKVCADKVKGKKTRGDKHYNAKLTEHEVKSIKYSLKNEPSKSMVDISKEYSTAYSNIQKINRGATWKWLESNNYSYPIR